MPTIVTCPDCQRQLRVPDDLLGKKVKCPDCKVTFTATPSDAGDSEDDAPNKRRSSSQGVSTGRRSGSERTQTRSEPDYDEDHPPSPYDDDLDEDEERPRTGGLKKAGWQRVRLGLSLMIYGIYVEIGAIALFLLCVILAIILAVVAGAGIASAFSSASSGGSGGGGTATAGGAVMGAIVVVFVGYGVLLLAQLVNLILGTTGHVFFLKIPDKPGAGRRSLAIAALSLWGASILALFLYFAMNCLGGFLGGSRGSGGALFSFAGLCFNLIGLACYVAWFFVFMFLLRSVALAMGNHALARQLVTYMIVAPVSLVLAFFGIIGVACIGGAAIAGMASSSSGSGQNVASAGMGLLIVIVVVYGLILLLFLALWIWYIVLLHQTRGAIKARYLN
jgi:predicted Zn finger-like uncharacterized protein